MTSNSDTFSGSLQAQRNTDRELWRETEGDYYADSIHVTEAGGIGINVGGMTVVMPLRAWHFAALDCNSALAQILSHWAEFGPEYGFGEVLDQAERAQKKLQQINEKFSDRATPLTTPHTKS